jgi:serine/threonine protein kinase
MRVCPKCFSLFADQERCVQDDVATVHYTEVLVGLNLGPYIVRSMVSEGGMGVVYVGEHPTLGRRVAMKVLRPELSLRDDIVERFVQEARAVNTIGHANIVNIYDFGRTPFGTFYIVMEFLEGRTLRALLDSAGPQPLERVRFVVEGIGAALAAAHNKGFLHRDIKPENVMVGHRGNTEYVKLLDFGIAKLLTSGNTTATSSTMGTPQYMSPEQLDDAKLDQRSDIFSFGCVIYELLTGQVPFPGGSQAGVRQAQLTRQPPPPSICRRDVYISTAVDDVVLRSIALEPDERQPTMEELLAAFRKSFDKTIHEQSTAHPAARKPRSSWKIFAVSGAFAVLLGTIAALVILLVAKDDKPVVAASDAGHPADHRPAKPKKLTFSAARKLALRRIEQVIDGDEQLATKAVQAIGEVRSETMRPLLHRALNKTNASATLKKAAVYALDNLGKPTKESVAALEKQLGFTNYRALRSASILALHGDEGARGKLRRMRDKLEKTGEPRKVTMAKLALCELSRVDRKLRKRALELWNSAKPLERGLLVRCLEILGPKGRKAARKVVARSGATTLRLRAADTLEGSAAWLGGHFKLEGRPKDPNQAKTAGLLARRGDQKSRKNLIECLADRDATAIVRAQCAIELGRLHRLGKLGAHARGVRAVLVAELQREKTESPELATKAAIALLAFR